MGRPSLYSPELLTTICERLAEGEPLAVICRDEGMPAARTVRSWALDRDDVAAAIARARVLGFDAIAEECLEISNTPVLGAEQKLERVPIGPPEQDVVDPDGFAPPPAMQYDLVVVEEKRRDAIDHRKLQIETRLKLLAKWDPKRYGERLQHDVAAGGTLEALVAASLTKPAAPAALPGSNPDERERESEL